LAVFGRRRVGKTFLIRQVYQKQIVFQMTGIASANTPQQLANFFSVLKEADISVAQDSLPKNWFDAFGLLKSYLQKLKAPKKVIFFDELPWIDTPRSNFLSALEHFWNAWASARPDIIFVVCGSAASWMISRLINNRGGLYNRVTQRIRLLPLFNHADRHITIIETLAQKNKGLSREEIVTMSGFNDGGALTTVLRELEESGFISKSYPFGKKIRDSIYRLTDQYSLFYLKFIKDQKQSGSGSWLNRIDNPVWRAWSGYAYENICLQHIDALKKALGISGVYTEESSWLDKARSVQIDLLIDRRDHVINLCEVKFTQNPFSLTKAYKEELEKKLFTFKEETQTRKSVFPTLITTFGLKENIHSLGFIQNSITMDNLFEPG